MLFASDFSGLAPLIFGVPLVLIGLTIVSFYASSLGHWSGPVLAAPALVIGLLMTSMLAASPESRMVLPWLLCGTPLALGLASVGLWSVRRGTTAALSATAVLIVIVIIVLGTTHVLRANRLAVRTATVAEHRKLDQMERDYLAKEQAALAADPGHADAVKAKLKPDRDAIEEQRKKWQQMLADEKK